jgi:hypothetical protein
MEGRLLEGKYRVSRLIGEGGMGAVYEAEHTLIGRAVAVKVLHGDFAKNQEAIERFRREARAATAIRHPNIIEITDMGTTAEGQPFLVMELLEGSPLSSLIGEGRSIPTARIVDILSQVLDALDAAHKKGIVHRDLKPDNVFIVQDYSRPDFVKLLDFGISKMVGPGTGELSMTRTGSVMGTPNYMAPEQAMGKKDCDHRVDLWAVGIMLYEALTGRLPYLGDNYNELLTAILMTTPPTPRSINPAISAAIERVILRALAREREQRYQTATELRDELRDAVRAKGTAVPLAALAPQPAAAEAAATAPGLVVAVRTDTPFSTATPTVPLAARTPPPAKSATLTPGAYQSPVQASIAERKSPWALYLGAGAVAVAGIVVAAILLTSKGSPSSSGSEVSSPGASPTTPVGEGDGGGALEPATATDPAPVPGPDADASAGRDEATASVATDDSGTAAIAPDAGPRETATPESTAPDAGRPDAGRDASAVDTTAPRDSGAGVRSPPDAARPPLDRGQPPRDAGPRVHDARPPPAADDGGRSPLRRDYT